MMQQAAHSRYMDKDKWMFQAKGVVRGTHGTQSKGPPTESKEGRAISECSGKKRLLTLPTVHPSVMPLSLCQSTALRTSSRFSGVVWL